jgi:hypothetical protein
MNEQEAADIIEATGADWLPCGCLGTQSEHTCGPRETGDDARDERAFERDEATGQPITVAFTLTFTVDYGRWRYAAGVLSGDDPVADFREYIQTAPYAEHLRDGMGLLRDADGTVQVQPIATSVARGGASAETPGEPPVGTQFWSAFRSAFHRRVIWERRDDGWHCADVGCRNCPCDWFEVWDVGGVRGDDVTVRYGDKPIRLLGAIWAPTEDPSE